MLSIKRWENVPVINEVNVRKKRQSDEKLFGMISALIRCVKNSTGSKKKAPVLGDRYE